MAACYWIYGCHIAGIAIPNAETVPAKGTYKTLDKDGLTEIGTRHRGMSVRLSNERPANQWLTGARYLARSPIAL